MIRAALGLACLLGCLTSCVRDPLGPADLTMPIDLPGRDLDDDGDLAPDLSLDLGQDDAADLSVFDLVPPADLRFADADAETDASVLDLPAVDQPPDMTTPDLTTPDLNPPGPELQLATELVGGTVLDAASPNGTIVYALAAGYLWRFDGVDWQRKRAFPKGAFVATTSASNQVAVASQQGATWLVEESTDSGATFSPLAAFGATTMQQLAYVAATHAIWVVADHHLYWWNAGVSAWQEPMTGKVVNRIAVTGRSDVRAVIATSTGLMQLTLASNWENVTATPTITTADWASTSPVTGTLRIDALGSTGSGSKHYATQTPTGTWTDCAPSSPPASLASFDGAHLINYGTRLDRRVSLGCVATSSWTKVFETLYGASIGALQRVPWVDDAAVIPASFGVVRTTDGGTTFSVPQSRLWAADVRWMSADQTDGTVLVATDSGIWRHAADAGDTFYRVAAFDRMPAVFVGRRGGYWFASDKNGARLYSNDDGSTIQDPMTALNNPSFAADPGASGRYFLCDGGLIKQTTTNGASFTTLPSTSPATPPSCVAVTYRGGTLWILRQNLTAMRSIDGGQHWEDMEVGFTLTTSTPKLEIAPFSATTAYALDGGVLRRLEKSNATIVSVAGLSSIRDFTLDPGHSSRIYATGPEGLFMSEDAGASFVQIRTEPGRAIFVHPTSSANVYWATVADGMFVSW